LDGNDVAAVYRTALSAVEQIRNGSGPFFLECETYRWLEHVGPMFDHELNRTYRTREEVEAWMKRCPVQHSANRLLERGIATHVQLDQWKLEVMNEMTNVVSMAKASAWPESSTLFENVY
jgi:pyruvate dehydrogenase E1 component alpha subunit